MNNIKETALIVFQKNFQLGKVKTRLAKHFGDEKALDIYKSLVSKTLSNISEINSDIYIFYSHYIPENENISNEFKHEIQCGEDLGTKMDHALNKILEKGHKKAILIGTDCPSIKKHHINAAIKHLNNHDVVIGPAKDGGYYLIGVKEKSSYLFDNMQWSHSKVLKDTIRRIEEKEMNYILLEELEDIDDKGSYLNYLKTKKRLPD